MLRFFANSLSCLDCSFTGYLWSITVAFEVCAHIGGKDFRRAFRTACHVVSTLVVKVLGNVRSSSDDIAAIGVIPAQNLLFQDASGRMVYPRDFLA